MNEEPLFGARPRTPRVWFGWWLSDSACYGWDGAAGSPEGAAEGGASLAGGGGDEVSGGAEALPLPVTDFATSLAVLTISLATDFPAAATPLSTPTA